MNSLARSNNKRSIIELGNIGKPYANSRVYVLDQQQRLLPKGVPGELYIAGDDLAAGYWKKGELSQDRFYPDAFTDKPGARMYRSGDAARFNCRGEVVLLGRLDTQVNIHGHRVELAEIESALQALPEVEVAVLKQSAESKKLRAYVVLQADVLEREPTWNWPVYFSAALKKVLPVYMLPNDYHTLDALPLSDNGKVDRGALPDSDALSSVLRSPPEGEIETALAALWTQYLQPVNALSRDDDFFEQGGQSLLMTRLAHAIAQSFAVELPVRALFENSRLADMARLISTAKALNEQAGDSDDELEDIRLD